MWKVNFTFVYISDQLQLNNTDGTAPTIKRKFATHPQSFKEIVGYQPGNPQIENEAKSVSYYSLETICSSLLNRTSTTLALFQWPLKIDFDLIPLTGQNLHCC